MEDPEAVKRFSPPPEPSVYVEGELIQPGTAACWGCGIPLVLRHMLDILGPNTVMARAPGCAGVNLGITPFQTMLGIPYTLSNFASTAAMATGLKRGLRSRGKADVNVVALCGDGGTVDIGLQSLSGAAERGESLIFICYDNEAYMNTGIQRSGSTPLGAWTTTTPVGKVWRGKKRTRKNIDLIMAAHKIPYVATASVAYIRDYKMKIKKAFEVTRAGKGLAFIHVHQPCPTGWRFPGEKAIEVARTAVQTGAWSLFEAEEGKLRVNVKPRELVPVSEYLKSQGRFRHLSEEQIANIQEVVTGNYEKLLELEKTGIY
ncbi:MAG: thiamine pyrophosphate-dependent enzyme [Candidatus Bathyarchaeia archaeon]